MSIRLIPWWIVSILAVLLTFPMTHGIQSLLMSSIWSTPDFDIQDTPKYQLIDPSSDSSALKIGWNGENSLAAVSLYKGQSGAIDFIDDLPVPRSIVNSAWKAVNYQRTGVELSLSHMLWRPLQSGYKAVLYRNEDQTFVDQSVKRQFASPQIFFSNLKSGYLDVPIDIFGGLYLFLDDVPKPEAATVGDLDTLAITEFDQASEQLLKEVWAIDHQSWAVTPWWMFLLASMTVLVPWLLFIRVGKIWAWAIALIASELAFGAFSLLQWQAAFPLSLPILVVFLAWFWHSKANKERLNYQSLQMKHHQMTELWVGHLLDEGKPEAAFRYLKEQSLIATGLDVWQLVAVGFERNRQFDKSVECYQTILNADPKNSEAKNKIKQLSEVIDGSRTMAIGQSGGELPVGQVKNLSLGRYQISREIGRGAMGIVYEAEDPKIHRKVALKVVHLKSLGIDEVDSVKQRFFREAQAAGKLNHPNIVTVYDVGEEHDVAYIAMDLLKGKPLSSYVSSGETIELLRSVKWIAEAAEALGYAHENEVVHRDVKPANMIIEDKLGRLKLTDFGVARIAGVQQTQTGIVLGSPSYMSPEQIRGEKLTGKTDIFSLGVTLYQCITGELPFQGDTLPALAYAITQSKQSSPRSINGEVPVSLVRIVNKALQKDPAERHENAQELANSLNKWVNDHK